MKNTIERLSSGLQVVHEGVSPPEQTQDFFNAFSPFFDRSLYDGAAADMGPIGITCQTIINWYDWLIKSRLSPNLVLAQLDVSSEIFAFYKKHLLVTLKTSFRRPYDGDTITHFGQATLKFDTSDPFKSFTVDIAIGLLDEPVRETPIIYGNQNFRTGIMQERYRRILGDQNLIVKPIPHK